MSKFSHALVSSLLVIMIGLTACTSTRQGLFGNKSAHEKYGEKITSAGLQHTQLGALWFTAADKSLIQPLRITLPYKETGYFAADKPSAAGYTFSAKKGEQLVIAVALTAPTRTLFFLELWQSADANNKATLLTTADTNTHKLEYEIEKEGPYTVRLQPELLKGVEYTLTITTAPSLAFPVRQSDNPRVTSFWGADRDGGKRSHEGVDIFAKFRTPVVAAADGQVTRVNENELGGKVIFLRPAGKSYSLYYAHLDSQIAQPGQQVRAGEILGLIGNTGNARTTAPHLHFGIYTSGGAVDPFPFIDQKKPAPKAITANLDHLSTFMRTDAVVTLYNEPSSKGTIVSKTDKGSVLQVRSATENWYKVSMPGDTEGFVPSAALTKKPLGKFLVRSEQKLLDAPLTSAAGITTVAAGTSVDIIGTYQDYNFVSYKDATGWLRK